MARTPAQRGKVGNWLVESRLARGWDTQEKARAEIERLTAWRVPQSVYAEWESGRRVPSDANLERLRAFYGHEETGPAEGAGMAELVAAIRAQTAAMTTLIEELRLARQEPAALRAAVEETRDFAGDSERQPQADLGTRGARASEDPPQAGVPAGHP